jgi:hypothetical protein
MGHTRLDRHQTAAAILSLAAALALPDHELSDVQPDAEDSETSLSA